MACCEMCLLLTKRQTEAQLRIAHGRAQYAHKDTRTLLLLATTPVCKLNKDSGYVFRIIGFIIFTKENAGEAGNDV